MSVEAITWALSFPAENATEKAILLVIANHADGRGVSFPGQRSIAEQAACSDRTVRRVVESLEQRGVIRCEERRRRDGSRTSDFIVLTAFEQPDNLTGSGEPTGQSVQTYRTACPASPDTVSGLTTFEPSVNPQRTGAREIEITQADCERFWSAYPEAARVNFAKSDLPLALGRHAARLGSMERLIQAASRYAAAIRKADTKPKSLANWLREPALIDQHAPTEASARPPDSPEQWASFVGYYARHGEWCGPGPRPGEPGCQAPAEIQREHGFTPKPGIAGRGAA